jgi:cyclophilin family peptidyl-prolyl cis-trans isomerase
MDNFSETDIIRRMTDIKNGLTPKINPDKLYKPAGQDQTQDQSQAGDQTQASSQKQLENLAAQYDSAVLKTNFGDITLKFYYQESPVTVNNFMNLAKAGFYNGTKFHRVIKDFMIQGGDPNSKDNDWSNDGQGGPGYKFQDEINTHKLVKGSLAMANSGPNTNGSQFFIVTASSTPWLDGKHTNFGYVSSGLDVVDKIEKVKVNENDHPTEDVIINSVELIKQE